MGINYVLKLFYGCHSHRLFYSLFWAADVMGIQLKWGAFESAKNHKRQRRKRQSVTAKGEKTQTPKFV